MIFRLVLDLASTGTVKVPVEVTCRVLSLSRAYYYKWLKQPITGREWVEAHLINAAFDIHVNNPTLGYRFITDELHELGFKSSERRVWRLCSLQGIFSVHAKKRGQGLKPGVAVHDDLVKRKFVAERQDKLWLTDITEHPTNTGKLYLCAVKDVFSNRIIGYSMDKHRRASLAINAINMAVTRRGKVSGTIVHSDRGTQFRSHDFLEYLRNHGLQGSMGRVGACADNSAMESFFSLLQKNVLNLQSWENREELREAIFVWIECDYNRKRRQRRLGKQTPTNYEKLMKAATAA